VLAATNFQMPQMPVYGNVSASPLESVQAIREELDRQLVSSVRWTESVRAMIAAGAEQFVELGPKDVLCGLLRRIDSEKSGTPLNSAASLQQFAHNAG